MMICGHEERYVVQAEEGTAFCALCELEEVNNRLDRATEIISWYYENDKIDVEQGILEDVRLLPAAAWMEKL
jgi:hypothetical protein